MKMKTIFFSSVIYDNKGLIAARSAIIFISLSNQSCFVPTVGGEQFHNPIPLTRVSDVIQLFSVTCFEASSASPLLNLFCFLLNG